MHGACIVVLSGMLTLVVLLTTASTQAATRTLAFDYVEDDLSIIDHFILERTIVGTTEVELEVILPPAARMSTDLNVTPGVPYCWQLVVETLGRARYVASNKVCATFRQRGRAAGRMRAQ